MVRLTSKNIMFIAINIMASVICSTGYAINTEATGYQVVNGAAAVTINPSHSSSCREVSNTSGKDQFVSTKTAAEWANFLANVPTGMAAATCGGAPITFVQSAVVGAAAATSQSITLTANAVPGSLMVLATAGRGSTHAVTSVIGCGANFTVRAVIGATNARAEIWAGVCTAFGSNFTVASSVGLIRVMQMMEFSNITGTLDVADAGTNQNSFTNSTAGVTTTTANTLIIAAGSMDKTATAGTGPTNSFIGATVGNAGSGGTLLSGFFTYRIVSATGTYSTSWPLAGTGSPNSCFISAALK